MSWADKQLKKHKLRKQVNVMHVESELLARKKMLQTSRLE